MNRVRRSLAYLLALFLIITAANLWFTSSHVNRDEHHWCAVLGDLDSTAMTARARADFTTLQRQFGCRSR